MSSRSVCRGFQRRKSYMTVVEEEDKGIRVKLDKSLSISTPHIVTVTPPPSTQFSDAEVQENKVFRVKLSKSLSTLGCSLYLKFGLFFKHIKPRSSFTEVGRKMCKSGIFGIGKRSPRSKILRVKPKLMTFFRIFLCFLLIFSGKPHNLPK